MGFFGQKGSDYLANVDINQGISLVDLMSEEDMAWMRKRADVIGKDVKTRVSRQLKLGGQRARGATSVGVERAAARFMRQNLDQTLRKVEAMRNAKNSMIELGDTVFALESEAKKRGNLAKQGSQQVGQNLNYHVGIAGIRAGKYASRKRALYKGIQAGVQLGSAFAGNIMGALSTGANTGAGFQPGSARGSISADQMPAANVAGQAGINEFTQERPGVFDLWGQPEEEFSQGLDFSQFGKSTMDASRKQPGWSGLDWGI